MKPLVRLIFLILGLAAPLAAQQHPAHPRPDAPDATPTEPAKPARHPLKGVVVSVLAERQALLVKHEEIPGVMRAMTMAMKVAPAVLDSIKPGQAVTGYLSRESDGWWLHDVEPTEDA